MENKDKNINQRIWVKIIFAIIVVETFWWLLEDYFHINFF